MDDGVNSTYGVSQLLTSDDFETLEVLIRVDVTRRESEVQPN